MSHRRRSMLAIPWLRLVLSILTLSACGSSLTGTAAELQFATATNSCAPTDAPAVSITLSARPISVTQADPPFLTVSVWTGLGELSGRTFRIARNSNDGFGEYYAATGTQSGPVTGTVAVNGVTRDSSIIGSVDVLLSDGSRLIRPFAAPWRPTRMRCG